MSNGPNFPWQVQLGPQLSGSGEGVVGTPVANFYVSTTGTGSYASYSTTGGSSWVPIPNNQSVQASGSNLVQFRWNVPQGVQIKFLIAAA